MCFQLSSAQLCHSGPMCLSLLLYKVAQGCQGDQVNECSGAQHVVLCKHSSSPLALQKGTVFILDMPRAWALEPSSHQTLTSSSEIAPGLWLQITPPPLAGTGSPGSFPNPSYGVCLCPKLGQQDLLLHLELSNSQSSAFPLILQLLYPFNKFLSMDNRQMGIWKIL